MVAGGTRKGDNGVVFVDGNGVSMGGVVIWRWGMVMVGQQHELPYATKVYLKIVKMVNFVTYALLKF